MTVPNRTTRMPAFWGYPPPPHNYPYHWVILDPKSKEDKVKVTSFKNSPKFQFWILKRALHATHLLKSLDKMCEYEMDPMSIVEDTGRTRFCPQTDRRTNRQGDTSIPPFQLRWSGGINMNQVHQILWSAEGRLNIKMSSYQYRKSHWNKTAVRSSYLHNGISYTGKMSSVYWIGSWCVMFSLDWLTNQMNMTHNRMA